MPAFLHTWFSDLTALFFPKNCAVCGSVLRRQEEILCTSCYYKLPETHFENHYDNPVMEVFKGRLPLVSATSFLFFSKGGITQQLIHKLKYKGRRDVGIYMGQLLGNRLNQSPLFSQADFIVPVPLHPKKEHARGYNQSLMLARGLALRMQAQVMPRVLFRKTYTATQTKKSRYERWENVKDIFEIKNGHRLEGKQVLLVDDVITTGATLEACGSRLLEIPGLRLSIASLAYAEV